MNIILEEMRNNFIEQVSLLPEVLGAWNFGSETHGLSDEFSDVDIILLIEGNNFDAFVSSLDSHMQRISDEVLLCWPEEFNSEAIINNGYLLSRDEKIFQFDIFLLNSRKLDDFMCRLHYMDLKEENVIFDKKGLVQELVLAGLKGNYWSDDIVRLEQTFWYHANMTSKYLKRKDYFKLRNVINTLFETHLSMLLTGYDKITWGGSANKLRYIPKEKQEHLKLYYCLEDFEQVKVNLIKCMNEFQMDAKDVYAIKVINYSTHLGDKVMKNWLDEMN